jgi:hypothetical protein
MTPDTAMATEKFDAYGEVLPDASRGRRDAVSASTALSRIGQYVFWLLVVVIVSVRILIYPATPAFDVGTATASKQTVTR